jgi:hypothetical protein
VPDEDIAAAIGDPEIMKQMIVQRSGPTPRLLCRTAAGCWTSRREERVPIPIDSMFMICSYAARPTGRVAMDNRINEIRKTIRALRVSMLEAEAIMHEQINRDEECSFVAGEILKMCGVMSQLVKEKERLGDREPIFVEFAFIPRRLPTTPRPIALRPVKRHLVPHEHCA